MKTCDCCEGTGECEYACPTNCCVFQDECAVCDGKGEVEDE